MLNVIETINSAVNNFVWGVPAMICIFGVGLYLSIPGLSAVTPFIP